MVISSYALFIYQNLVVAKLGYRGLIDPGAAMLAKSVVHGLMLEDDS